MGCPSSTVNGCRCPEHDLGLAAYAPDQDAYDRALARCRGPIRLSVVTFGPQAEPDPCTGRLTCTCADCTISRTNALARGAQGSGNASPFKVRPAA